MSHNNTNYQARLDFVRNLMRERFGLEAKDHIEVNTLQYDPESPFKYNNFVYRVALSPSVSGSTPASSSMGSNIQPGCVAIPEGVREFIVRLTNPDTEGMHAKTRVENEVAITSLASQALASLEPRVVPSIYGWGTAAGQSSQGWILQELMPGDSLAEQFEGMTLEQKKPILSQMATLLKALQEYQLPESITGFGGLTFNDAGQVVSAPMPTVGMGPWPSYEASFKGRLEVALAKADKNVYIKGWHANNVRRRLDNFIERGLTPMFAPLSSSEDKAIIHADFNAGNLLFDAASGRITALIDFDFSCILHPSSEFLRSFDGVGGQFRGWSSENAGEEQVRLMDAKLHGFPSPLPRSDAVDWAVAKAWEDELERLDVRRPRTMEGIDRVADVDTLLGTILPWIVSDSDILRLQKEQGKEGYLVQRREDNERELIRILDRLGF